MIASSPDAAIVVGDAGHSVLKALGAKLTRVPRVTLRDTDGEPDPASSSDVSSGRNSRYQLEGEIARGGMGAILKGRDADLGRDLAIKVLLDSHRDNPDLVARFVEEAQIGGQLQHPGIVPVHELGQFADERPFFSMKLVKGETLGSLLRERKDPLEDRPRFLGIFEQICQTMAYAHSRAVIHRDLKPANIMVGAFGEVQVMDWGLAKVLGDKSVADPSPSRAQIEKPEIVQTDRSGETGSPDSTESDQIWLNDGGQFSNSGQNLGGNTQATDVALGDLDADGDLDALITHSQQPNRIWINQNGNFSDNGQELGNHQSRQAVLGDLDSDGDLDAFINNEFDNGPRVWLNDQGQFAQSQVFAGQVEVGGRVALGDLDGDGDLDLLFRHANSFRVWSNQDPANQVSMEIDSVAIGEGDSTTITATLPAPATQDVAVNLGFTGTAALEDDYSLSSTQLTIPTGSMAGSITITAVQDSLDESDETVVVDITSVSNGQEVGEQQVTVTIVDDDEPVVPAVALSASPAACET